MKFVAVLAAFCAVAIAAPTLEDRPIEAREPEAEPEVHPLVERGCPVSPNPDQSVIDRVYKVGLQRGLNAKLMLATFETMRVESNYQNLHCGDKDSAGCFQQRPSMQVWGTYAEITNVEHAANAFMNALIACNNKNSNRSAGQLAQCAQVSERPFAYDQAEGNARSELAKAQQRNGSGSSGGAINVGAGPSSGGSSSSGSCTKSFKAVSGDTCSKIAGKGGINLSTFYSLNPSVNKSCSNLKVGTSYCVKKGTSTSAAKPSTSGCSRTYTVNKGDTCSKLAGIGKITLSKFYSLNAGKVNSSCSNLQVGQKVCIA